MSVVFNFFDGRPEINRKTCWSLGDVPFEHTPFPPGDGCFKQGFFGGFSWGYFPRGTRELSDWNHQILAVQHFDSGASAWHSTFPAGSHRTSWPLRRMQQTSSAVHCCGFKVLLDLAPISEVWPHISTYDRNSDNQKHINILYRQSYDNLDTVEW